MYSESSLKIIFLLTIRTQVEESLLILKKCEVVKFSKYFKNMQRISREIILENVQTPIRELLNLLHVQSIGIIFPILETRKSIFKAQRKYYNIIKNFICIKRNENAIEKNTRIKRSASRWTNLYRKIHLRTC